jgi:hypothetical protein
MSDDPNIHRLTLLLADAITGDAQGRGSDDYAQRDSRGRVLATIDGVEYAITVVPNTELPGVTRKPYPAVRIRYTNHRGETAVREVRPQRVWFGATEWHPEPQWLLDAVDVERGVERSFALRDVAAFDVQPEATEGASS